MTGAIYSNIISHPSNPPNPKNKLKQGKHFLNNSLRWSLETVKILHPKIKQSNSKKIANPTFVLKIGSRESRSSIFNQWHVTYNPSYSYIRPWWISTFSLTLMSTASYFINGNLNPGFCPYNPKLTVNKLYALQNFVEKTFSMKKAKHKVTSMAWPHDQKKPSLILEKSNGLRNISKNKLDTELWLKILRKNSSYYKYNVISLETNKAAYWAVTMSLIIAGLCAIISVFVVIYVINSVYISLIDIVTSASKYSKIDGQQNIQTVEPLMGAKKTDDSQGDLTVPTLSFSPTKLFRQLYVIAPPLSAFVDYLCVMLTKKYRNSAAEFYQHIFRGKSATSNTDEELHDLDKEQILGTEMKTLYEKFCYLNGLIEQKLDEEKNIKILNEYGYKIIMKSDCMTENYTRVKISSTEIPTVKPQEGLKSLQLFIKNVCKLSNFDTDNVTAELFKDKYKEFCTLNHFDMETITPSNLQKSFSIQIKYLPQQWVVRNSYVVGERATNTNTASDKLANLTQSGEIQKGFTEKISDSFKKMTMSNIIHTIDRAKVQNHFYLIMGQAEKIEDTNELTLARTELILFSGWTLVDAFTVLAHMISIFLMAVPLLGFTILEKIEYSDYSLLPREQLITSEDIFSNVWVLPLKLYHEVTWIKIILFAILIFWAFAYLDLIYYYIKMEFPQEKFFQKSGATSEQSNILQIIFRRTMWTLVLISSMILLGYICLAVVWLILGAIISPSAYLPLATAAGTFVAFVSSKYSAFSQIAENGFKAVQDFVKGESMDSLNTAMKKMNIGGELPTFSTDQIKNLTAKASEMGILDKGTMDKLKTATEKMATNPTDALKEVKESVQHLAENPKDFLKKMAVEMEKKAINEIIEKITKLITKVDPYYLKEVINHFLKKDIEALKNNIHYFCLVYKDILHIPEGVLNMLWEFAFVTSPTVKEKEFFISLLNTLIPALLDALNEKKQKENYNVDVELPINSQILYKLFTIVQAIVSGDVQVVTNEIISMIESTEGVQEFQILKKNKDIFNISRELLGGNFNLFTSWRMVKDFLERSKIQVHGFITEILPIIFCCFKWNGKPVSRRSRKSQIDRFLLRLNGTQFSAAYLTLITYFLDGDLDFVSKDIIKEILDEMEKQVPVGKKGILERFYEGKDRKPIRKEMIENVCKLGMENFQTCFHILGIIPRSPENEFNLIKYNAENFGIDTKYAKLIEKIRMITYGEFLNEEELSKFIAKNDFFKDVSIKMRLSTTHITGLLSIITHRYQAKEISDLLSLICKFNKIDIKKVLYALRGIGIPSSFCMLALIGKNILNPALVTDYQWIHLGLQDDELLNERYEIFEKSDTEKEKWIKNICAKLKAHKENLIDGGNDGDVKSMLLTIGSETGEITQTKLIESLKLVANVKNKIAKINDVELNVLLMMLSLRNIKESPPGNRGGRLDQDTKQAITEFAKLVNIQEAPLEQFLNLLLLSQHEKVTNALCYFNETGYFAKNRAIISQFMEYVISRTSKVSQEIAFFKNPISINFLTKELPWKVLLKTAYFENATLVYGDIVNMTRLAVESLMLEKDTEIIRNSRYYEDLDRGVQACLPIIQYLSSCLDLELTLEVRKKFNVEYEGIAVCLKVLNYADPASSLSEITEYLSASLGEWFKSFLAGKIFFEGKSKNVLIHGKAGDPQKYTPLQYLSKIFGIYPEFFQAFTGFYNADNYNYVDLMIKYFRRREALSLPPNSGIPIQSLVKINPNVGTALLNLTMGIPFNIQVISKELSLPTIAIEFVSLIVGFAKANIEEKKKMLEEMTEKKTLKHILEPIKVKDSEFLCLLHLLYSVYQPEDIRWLLKGLALEGLVDESILKGILSLDSFLPLEIEINDAKRMLDQMLLQANSLIAKINLNYEKNPLQMDSLKIASVLAHGDYTVLTALKDELAFLLPDKNEQDIAEIYAGLCGITQCRDSKIFFNVCLRDIYNDIKPIKSLDYEPPVPKNNLSFALNYLTKHLNLNPIWTMLFYGNISAWNSIWNYFYNLDESNKDHMFNPIMVLYFVINILCCPKLFNELFADSEWVKSHLEILKEFKKIREIIKDKDEQRKEFDKFFPQQSNYNIQAFSLDDKIELIETNWENYINIAENLKNELFTDFTNDIATLKEKAQEVGFNMEVFNHWPKDMLTDQQLAIALKNGAFDVMKQKVHQIIKDLEKKASDNEIELKKQKELYDYFKDVLHGKNQDSQKGLEDILKTEDEEKKRLIGNIDEEMLNTILYDISDKMFLNVSDYFNDPRIQIPNESFLKGKSNLEKDLEIQYKYESGKLTEIFYINKAYNFTVLSALMQLKKAYSRLDHYTDRGEDHTKLVAYNIDIALSVIEKYNYFKEELESFSKLRFGPVIGLSTGFCLKTDDFFRANVNAPILTPNFIAKYYQNVSEWTAEKTGDFALKLRKLHFKINEITHLFLRPNEQKIMKKSKSLDLKHYETKAISFRIMKNIKLKAMKDITISENYTEILSEPENFLENSFQAINSLQQWDEFYSSDMAKPVNFFKLLPISKKMELNPYDKKLQRKGKENDIRTNRPWNVVNSSIDSFLNDLEKDEFKLLTAVMKGYYEGITEPNTFFTDHYPNSAQIIAGIVGINSEGFSEYIEAARIETFILCITEKAQSRSKSLVEILSYILGVSENPGAFFSEVFGVSDENLFGNVMKLAISSIKPFPDYEALNGIMKNMTLSQREFEVLTQIIQVACGNLEPFTHLLNTEKTKDKIFKEGASQAMKRIVWALEPSLWNSQNYEINLDTFNLKEKVFLTINEDSNDFDFDLTLLEMASLQSPIRGAPKDIILHFDNADLFGDNEEKPNKKQKENLEKRPKIQKIFEVISNLMNGDFIVFFSSQNEKEEKLLLEVLQILKLVRNESDFKLLKALIALKPQKVSQRKQINIYQTVEEVYNAKLISLPQDIFTNKPTLNKAEIELKLCNFFVGIAHWNIPIMLKGLDRTIESYGVLRTLYTWRKINKIIMHKDKFKGMDSLIVLGLRILFSLMGTRINKVLTEKSTDKKQEKNIEKKCLLSKNIDAKSEFAQIVEYVKKCDVEGNLSQNFVTALNLVLEMKKDKNDPELPNFWIKWLIYLGDYIKNFNEAQANKIPIPDVSRGMGALLEQYMTGLFLRGSKNKFCGVLLEYLIKSYLLFHDKTVNDIPELKAIKPLEKKNILIDNLPLLVNSLINGGMNESQATIFNAFLNGFIVMQIRKGIKEEFILKSVLKMIGTIVDSMTIDVEGTDIKKEDIKDLIKLLLNLITGYDITIMQKKGEGKNMLTTFENKIVNKYIIKDPFVKQYLNFTYIYSIFDKISEISKFSKKTLSDEKFVKTLKELIDLLNFQGNLVALRESKIKEEKKGVEVKQLFELNWDNINILLDISQMKFEGVKKLIMLFVDGDTQKAKMILDGVQDFSKLAAHITGSGSTSEGTVAVSKESEEIVALMDKIKNGTASNHELFVAIDREGDSSGSISKSEYNSLAKKLQVDLTEHRINEIFAAVKKASGNSSDDSELNEEEFSKAMEYLQNKNTDLSLDLLGISPAFLTVTLIVLGLLLLLIFIFIFIGIAAFAMGGAMGSIINSIIPAAAGAGMGSKDDKKASSATKEKLMEIVKVTKQIIQSNKL